jgi:hypothetical protein
MRIANRAVFLQEDHRLPGNRWGVPTRWGRSRGGAPENVSPVRYKGTTLTGIDP